MKFIYIFLFSLLSSNIFCNVIDLNFLNYIKESENSIKYGYTNEHWYPYESIEGGRKTIAYGHKLKDNESFDQGITEEEALLLLNDDLIQHELIAKNYIEKKFNIKWNELPLWKKQVFTDYSFNGVLKQFPKFNNAVINDDYLTMKKEYKRYVTINNNKVELKDRNERFYNLFLKGFDNSHE